MEIDRICGSENWKDRLQASLPVLGHRNWIVIADSAYPAQARNGITTIATSADHSEVLGTTLHAIRECKHLNVDIYMDTEFKHVTEDDAPGIAALRRELKALIDDQVVNEVEHEQLIAKLDESARLFQVLVLKSTVTIPYASVFIHLNCGYWNPSAEERLRKSMSSRANV